MSTIQARSVRSHGAGFKATTLRLAARRRCRPFPARAAASASLTRLAAQWGADVTFPPQEQFQAELDFLQTLDWTLSAPTSLCYLEYFARCVAPRAPARRRELRARARELLRRSLAGEPRASRPLRAPSGASLPPARAKR